MPVENKEFVDDVVIERPQDKVEEVDVNPEEETSDIRTQIADKYNKQFNPEPEEDDPEPKEDDPEHDDGNPELKDEDPKHKEEDSTHTEVIVNGQRIMAENAKIEAAGGVENYQKAVAAHQGLQEVAKQRKLLANEKLLFEQERRLAEQQQNTNLPPSEEDDSSPEEDLTSLKETQKSLMKQYNDALYSSDEDKATVLLEELISNGVKMSVPKQPTQKPIDQDEIINTAVNRIHQENEQAAMIQRSINDAKDLFKKEYADVYDNTTARNIANEQTKVLKRQNPNWSPEQVIMKAGEITRTIVEGLRQDSEVVDDAAEKQNKIANKIKNSAVKPTGQRAAAKTVPKRQTNSDYITQLRKDRGLE